ncbi:hypothetical protein D8X85_00150 [Listeria seeligeri]|uniref:ArpU family phage packaging/lysis transcriptional regulator n=1 Tax=Listeria seeligeri TaxID=1640 RepID=UPI001943DF40|nr:ArpU family phage packaging/lysis transcriptional regulator [Listeria seeligeri]MBM5603949.1 hypothetical protein [Listeria seeligeri]MBM5675556.1 hypothetical protein [Listeria seeligeri]
MLITKNNIDYIKTVQKVKHFFEEFQQLRYVSGLTLKPQLSSDGFLEEPVFPVRDDEKIMNEARLVKEYTKVLNQMDKLYRNILVSCYIERKKNVAVMLELPYEIAQFKRIKKRAVLALATEMGIVVRKNN